MVYATTGHQPFGNPETPVHALYFKVLEGQSNLTGVPDDLYGIIADAFNKDPAARPTAHQLLGRLTGTPVHGDPSALADQAILEAGRHYG